MFKRSETWVALLGGLLQGAIAAHLVPQGAEQFVSGAIVYVVGRLAHHAVNPAS